MDAVVRVNVRHEQAGNRSIGMVTAGDVTVTVYESLDSPGRIVVDIDAPSGTDLVATVNDGYVFNAQVPA